MFRFKMWYRLLASLRLVGRLLREPRVPLLSKAVPILAGLYILAPVDFVPDFLLGLGEIDDLVVAIVAVEVFFRICPRDATEFHQQAIASRQPYSPMVATVSDVGGEVIDAQYRKE